MSKLFTASTLLCTLAGVILLPSSGCSQPESEPFGSSIHALGEDAGDADAAPAFKKGDLVISQVHWYGGIDAAGYSDDFIEIFNRSRTATIPLKGLSIQLATSTGLFGADADDRIALKDVSLEPGQYFLLSLKNNLEVGQTLTPDQEVNITGVELGKDNWKIALVIGTGAADCGTSENRCGSKANVLDVVGLGPAVTDYEGGQSLTQVTPPEDIAKRAYLRKMNGCTDENNNRIDFEAKAPTPRMMSSSKSVCPLPPVDGGVDGGDGGRDSGPVPGVPDPELGEESAFDGGVRRDAGGSNAAGSDEDSDCAVSPGPKDLNAGLLGAAVTLGIALSLRRRRSKKHG